MSSGPWKHPPRPHRTTWNYQVATKLERVTTFIGSFIFALFVLSLIVRAILYLT